MHGQHWSLPTLTDEAFWTGDGLKLRQLSQAKLKGLSGETWEAFLCLQGGSSPPLMSVEDNFKAANFMAKIRPALSLSPLRRAVISFAHLSALQVHSFPWATGI